MLFDPPWLRLARSFIGKDKEVNRLALAVRVAQIWPDMADYCKQVSQEIASAEQQNWCGLYLAFCLSAMGHRPPFKPIGSGFSRQHGFMRPFTWSVWGEPSWRLPGDVAVFDLGGYHHATFYLDDNRDGTWACLGASQGPNYETVVWNYKGAKCVAVRRPEPVRGQYDFQKEHQRVAKGISQVAQEARASIQPQDQAG